MAVYESPGDFVNWDIDVAARGVIWSQKSRQLQGSECGQKHRRNR